MPQEERSYNRKTGIRNKNDMPVTRLTENHAGVDRKWMLGFRGKKQQTEPARLIGR